jgi:predicted methyltransferase
MFKTHFVCLVLLVACSGKKDAPATTGSAAPTTGSAVAMGSGSAAGSGVGSGSAELIIPPYTPAEDTSGAVKTAILAPDRTPEDRALDAGRKPGEVFTFFKIASGQKIGELFAGGGYSTELMARIVGTGGVIYAQNTKEVNDRFARKPFELRMAKAVMKVVKPIEAPADAPFPADAKDLDAVVCILNYHDFVWQKVDRAKLNKAVFDALKPGGVYAIVDHSATAGSGEKDAETLHRIDEELVKKEITAAGFKLDAESDVLRNAEDKRDWNSSPKAAGAQRGHSDRFTLRFVKPAKK